MVKERLPLVWVALLVKLGEPVDCTLWEIEPAAQVHVSVPFTAIVSTAGFEVLFRALLKLIPGPTVTAAVVGIGSPVSWKTTLGGVRVLLVAVTEFEAMPSSVSVAWALPLASVVSLGGMTVPPPVLASHLTLPPDLPLPSS